MSALEPAARHAAGPGPSPGARRLLRIERLDKHFGQLHVLRELAQHCGHADILREQILNG